MEDRKESVEEFKDKLKEKFKKRSDKVDLVKISGGDD